jgi:hypothetical protein
MKMHRALSVTFSAFVAIGLGVTMAGQAPTRGPITPHAYPLVDDHYVRFPLPAAEQAYARIDGAHV